MSAAETWYQWLHTIHSAYAQPHVGLLSFLTDTIAYTFKNSGQIPHPQPPKKPTTTQPHKTKFSTDLFHNTVK